MNGLLRIVSASVCLSFASGVAAGEAEGKFDPGLYWKRPTLEWLPEPVPVADADASTEAEMKPYAEVLAGVKARIEMVPIRGGRFQMGFHTDAHFIGFRVVRPLRPEADAAASKGVGERMPTLHEQYPPTTADGLIPSPEPGWPQWRGPRRDGISEETGLLKSWPEGGPELLWKVDDLGRGWSSPIVAGGRLYITGDVGDDLVIYAFDTGGKLLWRTANGKSWQGSYPGCRACCALSEGRLYQMNAHGRVACLDPATGKELWAVNILQRFDAKNITWGITECLLVDGPRVIVTPGGKKALMAALDKRTGETVWTTPPLGDDRPSHSSPILFRCGGRRVISQCSSAHGFGVDADTGKLLWTVSLENRFGVNTSTPVYGAGRVYYVTPYGEEGRQYRLRPNGNIFDAELAWMCTLDTVTGGGVLVDGTLYSAGYRENKWWLALDWQTGEKKGESKDFTTGAAIYADGRLYVLDEQGTVGLLEPASDGLETAGQFRLFDRKSRDAWAHPVLAAGRLYLRYHDTLWCYRVKAE